jgi:DNA-binding NarL/FixJ family response regulator
VEIAEEMGTGRAAVSNHLVALYQKFAIEEGRDRRAELANAAIYRRAVTMEQLREAKKKRDEEGG